MDEDEERLAERVLAERLQAHREERQRLSENIRFTLDSTQWHLSTTKPDLQIGWPDEAAQLPAAERYETRKK